MLRQPSPDHVDAEILRHTTTSVATRRRIPSIADQPAEHRRATAASRDCKPPETVVTSLPGLDAFHRDQRQRRSVIDFNAVAESRDGSPRRLPVCRDATAWRQAEAVSARARRSSGTNGCDVASTTELKETGGHRGTKVQRAAATSAPVGNVPRRRGGPATSYHDEHHQRHHQPTADLDRHVRTRSVEFKVEPRTEERKDAAAWTADNVPRRSKLTTNYHEQQRQYHRRQPRDGEGDADSDRVRTAAGFDVHDGVEPRTTTNTDATSAVDRQRRVKTVGGGGRTAMTTTTHDGLELTGSSILPASERHRGPTSRHPEYSGCTSSTKTDVTVGDRQRRMQTGDGGRTAATTTHGGLAVTGSSMPPGKRHHRPASATPQQLEHPYPSPPGTHSHRIPSTGDGRASTSSRDCEPETVTTSAPGLDAFDAESHGGSSCSGSPGTHQLAEYTAPAGVVATYRRSVGAVLAAASTSNQIWWPYDELDWTSDPPEQLNDEDEDSCTEERDGDRTNNNFVAAAAAAAAAGNDADRNDVATAKVTPWSEINARFEESIRELDMFLQQQDSDSL